MDWIALRLATGKRPFRVSASMPASNGVDMAKTVSTLCAGRLIEFRSSKMPATSSAPSRLSSRAAGESGLRVNTFTSIRESEDVLRRSEVLLHLMRRERDTAERARTVSITNPSTSGRSGLPRNPFVTPSDYSWRSLVT